MLCDSSEGSIPVDGGAKTLTSLNSTKSAYLRVLPWRPSAEAGRGGAAATTWIFRGGGHTTWIFRGGGRDVDIPWREAATTWIFRGGGGRHRTSSRPEIPARPRVQLQAVARRIRESKIVDEQSRRVSAFEGFGPEVVSMLPPVQTSPVQDAAARQRDVVGGDDDHGGRVARLLVVRLAVAEEQPPGDAELDIRVGDVDRVH